MNRRPAVALGFLALIAVGAALLSAPFARTPPGRGSREPGAIGRMRRLPRVRPFV